LSEINTAVRIWGNMGAEGNPMTPRQTLSLQDLIALLNWELAAYDECDGSHVTAIRHMHSRDDAGCNWLDARVQSDHSLGTGEHFIVRHVIEQTRREFDLRTH
jgi:hypothetical protein